MKILFVDDAADVKNYVSKVLKNWGYQVELASDGLEALKMIRQKEIQLVISDWMMPEMNGLQLCNELRSSDFGHYVYLILLTAKSDSNDLVEGLSAGADDFISKPINTEILKAKIDSAVRVIEMENKLAHANNLLQDQNEGIKSDYAQLDANMQEIQQIIGDTEVVVLKSKNSNQPAFLN